ncbi:class I SAM-dependent methyltransferase [soil metagenome]
MTTPQTFSLKILQLFCSFLLLNGLAQAQTGETSPQGAETEPPALTEYLGRTIAQTMHWSGGSWLIRNKREREEASTLMREKLELKPGMVVCDLGCGNGYHTLPMAQTVAPNGKVYGSDVQPEMLKMLEDRAKAGGITNIVPVLGLYHDAKLPKDTFDLILLVDVYHEFSHPVQMLAGIRDALKPDGQVVFVEFRSEDDSVPIKPEHKMTKAQLTTELSANGFKLTKEFDGLPWQHMMWYGKGENTRNEPSPK